MLMEIILEDTGQMDYNQVKVLYNIKIKVVMKVIGQME